MSATFHLPDLSGQVVLITGGNRGIGRALAEALAAAGAAVAVVARSAEQLSEAVDAISASHGRAIGIAADVSDRLAVENVVKQVESEIGPVDLLINNAAVVTPIGPIAEVDPDAWWRCQEINVRGPLLCARAVLPTMCARGRGRIVNVVSMSAIMPLANMSAYLSSKTAVIRLSELLALETQTYGVRVFSVSPGTVRTEMTRILMDSDDGRQWTPWVRQQFDKAETPMERVVALMLAIAAGRADHLTGRLINAREDFEQVFASASEIEQEGLYILRVQTLHGSPNMVWDSRN